MIAKGENRVMVSENTVKELKTWGGGSTFSYKGNVATGTEITFGESNTVVRITKEQFEQLLTAFRGKSVKAGTSRDMAPAGSLGHWLQQNITPRATASYVGAILVDEGYAEKEGSMIIFH
jgi:hypothetical protein